MSCHTAAFEAAPCLRKAGMFNISPVVYPSAPAKNPVLIAFFPKVLSPLHLLDFMCISKWSEMLKEVVRSLLSI